MENWREKLLELELLHCNHSNKDCTREDKGNFLAFKLRGKAQLCRRHLRQAFEHRTQDVSPSSAAHIFKQKISAASAFIKQGALFPVLTASDSLIYFFFFSPGCGIPSPARARRRFTTPGSAPRLSWALTDGIRIQQHCSKTADGFKQLTSAPKCL